MASLARMKPMFGPPFGLKKLRSANPVRRLRVTPLTATTLHTERSKACPTSVIAHFMRSRSIVVA